MNKPKPTKGVLGRVIKLLISCYPVLVLVVTVCIILTAAASAIPAVFTQKVIAVIEKWYKVGDWSAASKEIFPMIAVLVALYLAAIILMTVREQLMAYITQGFLCKLRRKMFDGMQNLPIKYFDTTKHGDIMSYYTNDIDTLRQLVSQALPALISSGIVVMVVFFIMLYYSIWMTMLLLVGVVAMTLVSKKVGGGSAKYFVRQQASLGKAEGFIQEMMNGQKVIKVFCHEEAATEDFDKINEALYEDSRKANAYANTLGPIIMNIGNVLYVLIATAGGLFLTLGAKNFSISGMAFSISIIVPFLNMTKQFTGNINQVSQQVNAIVMAMAGAQRIFSLMDQQPETDDGYVTLVNAKEENGELTETSERTGKWAWKHPHGDGTITYTEWRGDVRFHDVSFSYDGQKTVLKHVSLYAMPGQKIAFVGSTGAGKTTITNLVNRFYDVTEGKITYDGINIKKIKKADLRRSMGMVLQDTHLFTGTVRNNIAYGRLDATDDEIVAAAKLANADSFITRLPEGYNTMITGDGVNLSQGQRQLLAIARAAVADPPVLILDEATSSIDTRTERLIEKGMDKLMEGRTVFVIAHRLSTVRNSDAIMVLEHGEIIERGSHDDLIAQQGKYYQLYTGQFELD